MGGAFFDFPIRPSARTITNLNLQERAARTSILCEVVGVKAEQEAIVTQAMIEAGAQVLGDSGLVDPQVESLIPETIKEILLASLTAKRR